MERHWDHWKQAQVAGTKPIKHKGSAIADLERARRDPDKYGVTKEAVMGPRPDRQARVLPTLPSTKSEGRIIVGDSGMGALCPRPSCLPD